MTSKQSEQSKLIDPDASDQTSPDESTRGCSPIFCRFPAAVYFIVVNELCERFNYFGVRTVLTLYLIQFIGLGDDNATAVYHLFVVLCYFSPVIGGVLADSMIGRFWTILVLSIVYCIGGVVLAATAVPHLGLAGAVVGLLLIGIGTGGIKPNVCAFGADQLPPDSQPLRNAFFSCFYFFINLGSIIATILIPIIRSNVVCYGTDCYSLAFSVPTVVMVMSIIVFVAGKRLYRCNSPSSSVVVESVVCVASAVRNYRAASVRDSDKQLLDYADPVRFSPQFVADLRQFNRLLVLYIPFPIFWALFDQIGSRWTIQASRMDGYVGAGFSILPDQMQALNSLLILITIPIFDCVIYPLIGKLGISMSLLKRMGIGMLLASGSFFLTMAVQMRIEQNAAVQPHSNQIKLKLVNALPNCELQVQLGDLFDQSLSPRSFTPALLVSAASELPELRANSTDCGLQLRQRLSLPAGNNSFDIVAFGGSRLQFALAPASLSKHRRGLSQLRVMSLLPADSRWRAASLLLSRTSRSPYNVTLRLPDAAVAAGRAPVSDYATIHSGFYSAELVVHAAAAAAAPHSVLLPTFAARDGQVLTLALTQDSKHKVHVTMVEDVRANSVKMLLQVPQYIMISVAEVLFAISGLSLSYAEAPDSMKSLVQAVWLVCIGIGNVVMMVVSEMRLLPLQSQEFLLFAVLMLLNFALFVILAVRYRPIADERRSELPMGEQPTEFAKP